MYMCYLPDSRWLKIFLFLPLPKEAVLRMEYDENIVRTVGGSGELSTSLEYIKSLLDQHRHLVNLRHPQNHQTALHVAAKHGRLEVMRLLLSYGASVNSSSVDGMTPLHDACLAGRAECVVLLLDNGADVNARNIDSSTPLCFAASKGCENCVRKLLAAGATVNSKVKVTFPPLHEAALNGHANCLSLIIDAGADIEICENQFGTALHVACLKGHANCLSILLNSGANPDVICRHETPLHIAAKYGYPECLRVLVDYGADIYRRDAAGLRAVDATEDDECRTVLKAAESPATLIQLCRQRIRALLRLLHSERKPASGISLLPLPQRLKRYLDYRSIKEHLT